jgi:hypothetical protein
MLRILILFIIAIASCNAFGQIHPWPWGGIDPWPWNALNQKLKPHEINDDNGIRAIAIRQDANNVIVVVFGKKPSPIYEASLTEKTGSLTMTIVGNTYNGPALQFKFIQKGDNNFVPQLSMPFAITRSIKTDSNNLWIISENNEAILLEVISP